MSTRWSFIILLVALSWSACSASSFRAIHEAPSQDFRTWADKAATDGYRVVYVNGFDAGAGPHFAAVAEKETNPTASEARIDLTDEEYQKTFDDLVAKGYRLTSVSGYLTGGAPHFAAVWVRGGAGGAWEAHHDMTSGGYSDTVARLTKRGLRPSVISGYADGAGVTRFAAVFVEAGKTPWLARHDLTSDQYQKLFDEYAPQGYRPATVATYPSDGGVRFAVVLVHDDTPWLAKHDLSAAQYQAEFEQHAREGYRPVAIAPYLQGGSATPEAFDQAMRTYMQERHIGAGALAVSRDGKLLLSRGYGIADPATGRRVEADDPMRLASVCKPITEAAIHKLIRDGKLSADTKAFVLLGIAPPPGQTSDPRLNDITIQLLLDHKGGWDRDKAFDPMFRPLAIANALGKPGPASADDVVRYMTGQPLQFDPGSRESYSNFGYCVLGRVIEKVTGENYLAYVRSAILEPIGIHSVELARSLPRDRNPREPLYLDPGEGRNVIDPSSTIKVPAPDGTFHIEAMDSHGGMIASAPDLIRFLDAYWINGEPRNGNGRSWHFFGSLPGTWTMVQQQSNGTNVAALFNQRTDPSGLKYEAIADVMREAGNKASGGETKYAVVWIKESEALPSSRSGAASEDPRTLIYAAIARGESRVVIPPGVYRMAPDKDPGVTLVMHDAHDLEIVADGVTMICTRRVRAVMFDHCRNVTLRGLTIDYDPLTFTQGKVVAIADDKGWMDIRLDAGYPQVLNDRIVICDPKTRFHKYGINHTWGTKASWNAPGIVRITLKNVAQHVDLGDPIAMSGGAEGGAVHGITIERNSSNITLNNLILHCAPGMGIVESGSDVGVHLLGCKIVPGPKPAGATEERLLTTSWDGIQCQAARVGADVEDCIIERCGDDSWSVPADSFQVYKRDGVRLLITPPGSVVRIGDRLMGRGGESTVVAAMRNVHAEEAAFDPVMWKRLIAASPGSHAVCEVTLDHELPIDPGQWLYDADYRSKGFIYRNNRIYSHGRGALVKVSDGLIEGNVFRGGDKAIVINPETESDAAPCDNLIIRNNIIRETGYHQAMPYSDEAGAVCLSHAIRLPILFHHILIEGNTFDSVKGLNLLISSASDVMVRNNTFVNTHSTDPGRHNGADRNIDAKAVIVVGQSDGVTFEGNLIDHMGPFADHAVVVGPGSTNITGMESGIRAAADK